METFGIRILQEMESGRSRTRRLLRDTASATAARPLNRTLDGITAGTDGNVWFLETVTINGSGELEIGKITPSGQITEYPLTSSSNPSLGRRHHDRQ